jgi:Putative transposase of IS4/5 family (DUF4096)
VAGSLFRRRALEAALRILNAGAQWHMPPHSFPNHKTLHRRFQTWCHNEVLRRVLTEIANELRDKGALDEEEFFIDATFPIAKRGGAEIGPIRRGNGLINGDRGSPWLAAFGEHPRCEPPRSASW